MSARLAALIAHSGYWILLAYGWCLHEIGPRAAALFLLLWVCGWLGGRLVPYGDAMFPSYVAVLDVALVLIIFKGDVRLT